MRYLAGLFLMLLALHAPTGTQAQELQEPHTKSAAVGVGVALASTIAPIAIGLPLIWSGSDLALPGGLLFAYGLIVGPFPGNAYAGDKRRGLKGMGMRTAVSLLGILTLFTSEGFENAGEGAEVLFTAGGVAWVATTVWNIWTIPSSVRRYNESLSVGPTIQPDGSFGLQVMLRW